MLNYYYIKKLLFEFCFIFATALFVLTGCASSTRPVGFNAHDACGINPAIWKLTSTPLKRDALLELRDTQSKEVTRKHFIIISTHKESWFENSNQDILGCRYKKTAPCGGGLVSTVIFSQQDASWKAEPVLTKVCSH
jgi:hypothetical protein